MASLLQTETTPLATQEAKEGRLTRWQRRGFVFLLWMGVAQFVWCYLYRIPSELHLAAYEHGLERMPFQSRLLLMEPLRWAHDSSVLQMWATRLAGWPAWFPRRVGPEGLLQAAVDCTAVGVSCTAATGLYRRCSRRLLLPWLVSPLLLVLCFITYIGLGHHSLRFVYDLPAMAFFSVGLWLLHLDRWQPWRVAALTAVFAIGTLNRETTLLLLVFFALAEPEKGELRPRAAVLGSALLLYWLCFHAWTTGHFRANPVLTSQHVFANLGSLLVPLSWPQLAGTLGFMWLPLIVFRRFIPDAVLRAWLPGLGVWLAFMTFYGLLVEIRLWGELLPYAACTVALVAEEMLVKRLLGSKTQPGKEWPQTRTGNLFTSRSRAMGTRCCQAAAVCMRRRLSCQFLRRCKLRVFCMRLSAGSQCRMLRVEEGEEGCRWKASGCRTF